MTRRCAFGDCGDPTCRLCALARIPSKMVSAAIRDGLRDKAQAEPKEAKEKALWMPKRKHRVGPHR